jgi:hypothetical protein
VTYNKLPDGLIRQTDGESGGRDPQKSRIHKFCPMGIIVGFLTLVDHLG